MPTIIHKEREYLSESKINGCGMEGNGNALEGGAQNDHADHERAA